MRLYTHTHTHTRHSTKKNGKYQLAKRELQVKEIGEKGITLVALAVTITVMLILGTISINAMFGENGVLKKAKEQGNKTKGTISESEARTNQLMQEYGNMMASGVGNEVDEASQDIIDNLKKQIEELQKQNEELKAKQATGNATEDQVLSGATFSTSNGVNLTGTMPSYTSGSQAVTTSGKWGIDTTKGAWTYIPRSGYYSTSYWLNIPWATIKGSLGNATTANVLKGATFTSENGVKLTGTMPSYTSGSQAVTTSGKWGFSTQYGAWEYIPNNGYYSTGHWLNIPWATIKGSLGTATTGNVLSGTTFTSTNGIKLTGTMANRSSTIQTATTSTSNTSASCYRINGSNIEVVPAIGYWGTWDWTKSCIKIPTTTAVKTLTGTYTSSSSTYAFKDYSGNSRDAYYLSISISTPHRVLAVYYINKINSNNYYQAVGNGYILENEIKWRYEMHRTHSDWETRGTLYLPTRNGACQYDVTIWYV